MGSAKNGDSLSLRFFRLWLESFWDWFTQRTGLTSAFRTASSVVKNQNYVHRLVHENEGLLFHLSGAETLASAYVVPDDSQARVAWCQSWKLPVEVLAFRNLGKSADSAHWFFAASRIPLHSLHKQIHKEASGFLVGEFSLGVSVSEFSLSSSTFRSRRFFWRW